MTLTARTVLIAELLGEVDVLLKRVEKLAPELDAAHARLAGTSAETIAGIERYRSTIVALTEAAQASAVRHIIQRTNEVCEGSLAAHAEAMTASAKSAFDTENSRRITTLMRGLEQALAQIPSRRYQAGLMFMSALTASALTFAVGALLLLK